MTNAVTRTIAAVSLLALLAASCGDSAEEEPVATEAATTTAAPTTAAASTTTAAPATTAPASTTAPAASLDDPAALIVGTFDSPWGRFEFGGDGTFTVTDDDATKDTGTYVVSDGQLLLTSAANSPNCAGLEANYFLGIDSPDNIRMLLNSEACDDRQAALDFKPLLRVSS